MPATRHNKAVADYLDANAGLAVDIYASPYREDMADDVICCLPTGGQQPDYFFDGGDESLKRPTVQVQIRGPQNDQQGTHDRASTVEQTISGADDADHAAFWVDNGPLFVKQDGQGRYVFTVNVRALIKE